MHTLRGDVLLNVGLGMVSFTVLIFVVGIVQGIGKASVYRSLADHYPNSMDSVSGLVGVIVGLGGFTMPRRLSGCFAHPPSPSASFVRLNNVANQVER